MFKFIITMNDEKSLSFVSFHFIERVYNNKLRIDEEEGASLIYTIV